MNLRKRKLGYTFAVLYTLGYFIWLMLYQGSNTGRTIISDILQTLPPIISFAVIFKANKKSIKRGDKFWLFILVGCGSYLLSQLLWDIHEIFLGIQNPVFIESAFLWGLSIASYIAAIAYKISKKKKGYWTKLFILDSLTVMCIAVAITWLYCIRPHFIHLLQMSTHESILYLVYPTSNLVCLFFSMYLYLSLHSNDPEKRPLYMICLSYVVMFIVNTLYSHLSIVGRYQSGSLIDPLWAFYLFMLAMAAAEYLATKEATVPVTDEAGLLHSEQHTFIVFVPIASVILLFSLMLFTDDRFVWFCSAASIVLITIKHALVILHNKQLISKLGHLNETLESKVAERTQELYSMAFYDQLTGLPNRIMLENSLKAAISDANKNRSGLALLFLDLDRFKTINDSFGHAYGDMILKEVANRLKKRVGSNDIICRQGGDEFAIVFQDSRNPLKTISVVQDILQQIAKPMEILGQSLHTTCSIGIAVYNPNNEDYGTLMKHADLALYQAKEKGKNTYRFYTEELNHLILKKLELENELAKAIENKEFVLYYQPQINSSNGKVIGAEALVRWIHPKLGSIPPSDFIPVAEETGLIKELGFWVLKTACSHAKDWHRQGFFQLKVGVNISPKQIQQENFVQQVKEVLNETGLPSRFLDLEITESASFQNEDDIIAKLNQLKQIGVQISIDDFGTGYSSLSYLNKLPVDTLKIAQQFVRYIKTDSANKAIITAIIAVAQSLNMNIIAEGVEEMYQYSFLKSQNCIEMQGYMFSKPLPLIDFIDILQHQSIQLEA